MNRWLLLLVLLGCTVSPPEPIEAGVNQKLMEEKVTIQPEFTPPAPKNDTFCEDSDTNESTKGTVRTHNDTLTDSCLFLNANGTQIPMNKVVEYSCTNGQIEAAIFECAFGCDDGACRTQDELTRFDIVTNGTCTTGKKGPITVTKCSNGCLPLTPCEKQAVETPSVSLPGELSCLARNENWDEAVWFEFVVQSPVNARFETEVLGSEAVMVAVDNGKGIVAAPLRGIVAENRCFAYGKGAATAFLTPGRYKVLISARGGGSDLFRSFKGQSFSILV